MRTLLRYWPVLVVVTIVVLFGFHRHTASLPAEVTLTTGPSGGRYEELTKSLADEIRKRFGIQVKMIVTEGSIDNIANLQSRKADFSLYQPESREIISGKDKGADTDIAFVANMYSEVLHIFVGRDSGIRDAAGLRDKRVAIGMSNSGDYATNRLLMQHLAMTDEDFDSQQLRYPTIPGAMREHEIDAACMTAGLDAPVFREMTSSIDCDLVGVPFAESMALRRLSVRPYRIPAGYYRTSPHPIPSRDVETIAARAQLITRPDVPTTLVEAVTSIVMDEQFQRRNHLNELFAEGAEFATSRPEFVIHPGADHVYNPELKPLINPDFVEGTEGLRSFIVSLLVAAWLVGRWWNERRDRAQEHRLDRYIRSLLDLEKSQLGLDEIPGGADVPALQKLLDEVTVLRQEALKEFTAHELKEDRAVECFIQLAHSLSHKISDKLSRQRMDLYHAAASDSTDHVTTTPSQGNDVATDAAAE